MEPRCVLGARRVGVDLFQGVHGLGQHGLLALGPAGECPLHQAPEQRPEHHDGDHHVDEDGEGGVDQAAELTINPSTLITCACSPGFKGSSLTASQISP